MRMFWAVYRQRSLETESDRGDLCVVIVWRQHGALSLHTFDRGSHTSFHLTNLSFDQTKSLSELQLQRFWLLVGQNSCHWIMNGAGRKKRWVSKVSMESLKTFEVMWIHWWWTKLLISKMSTVNCIFEQFSRVVEGVFESCTDIARCLAAFLHRSCHALVPLSSDSLRTGNDQKYRIWEILIELPQVSREWEKYLWNE